MYGVWSARASCVPVLNRFIFSTLSTKHTLAHLALSQHLCLIKDISYVVTLLENVLVLQCCCRKRERKLERKRFVCRLREQKATNPNI